ncbi:hypothetical protein PPERSA_05009 [Pseudocohnilembus persalinus]|uniref:Uncharacterized protein n=1 Tax=Pseudocohnilembus persalinus TaxID=266149 RepID=A0A0V0QVM1_PSEPJ|nr:hypothetical protein PPERSA_05009 [Pseudocohnilembus persalinus]|eukprot:KRX06396.1 hypothetical protein PPERSA_05009 [Pseudocohnilembus persalinus]
MSYKQKEKQFHQQFDNINIQTKNFDQAQETIQKKQQNQIIEEKTTRKRIFSLQNNRELEEIENSGSPSSNKNADIHFQYIKKYQNELQELNLKIEELSIQYEKDIEFYQIELQQKDVELNSLKSQLLQIQQQQIQYKNNLQNTEEGENENQQINFIQNQHKNQIQNPQQPIETNFQSENHYQQLQQFFQHQNKIDSKNTNSCENQINQKNQQNQINQQNQENQENSLNSQNLQNLQNSLNQENEQNFQNFQYKNQKNYEPIKEEDYLTFKSLQNEEQIQKKQQIIEKLRQFSLFIEEEKEKNKNLTLINQNLENKNKQLLLKLNDQNFALEDYKQKNSELIEQVKLLSETDLQIEVFQTGKSQ